MKALVLRDLDLLGSETKMVKSILNSPDSPDVYLSRFHGPKITESTNSPTTLKVVNKSTNAV